MKSLKLIAAAAVALAALACNKEQALPEEVAGGTETQTPQNGQSEEAGIPEGYVRLTFTTPADTKTALDKESGAVSWSKNDSIKICWDGGYAISKKVVISDGIARFTADVKEAAEDLYAVYPSSINASVSDGSFNVDIPKFQTGRFEDADIIVAKTTKTDLTYAFHHAVSLVRFVISEEGIARGITRAQFVDLANKSCLYGTLGITFSGTDIVKITEPTAEDNDVICIEEKVAAGDNWIAVPPTKSLTGYGLRMGTSSAWLPGIVGEKDYTFSAAGKRLSLGTVYEKINEGDWYIKPEATGTGDGKSWTNAGGPEKLQSLMGDYNSGNAKNLARAWRINGKTIKVAEGNYTAPGTNGFTARYVGKNDVDITDVDITIEGGYTASGTKSSSAQTVFGPKTGNDPYRAFFFYGDNVSVTLRDLYCSNHERTGSAGGGAIYSTGGASLEVIGCIFESNSTQNTRAGGAILFQGASLEMSNCTFSGNTSSTNGGAIYSSSDVSLDNCIFSSNNSTVNGGAIALDDGATLTIDGGSFIENYSEQDGGAIYLIASHLNANGVIFSSNTCRYGNTERNGSGANDFMQGGGAIKAYAETTDTDITASDPLMITLSGCLFNGNRSKYSTGGAFYAQATHLLLTADHCKFLNNRSNGNYSGPVFASETPSGTTPTNIVNLFFNSCEFRGNKSENFTSNIGPSIGYIHYAYTNLGFNNCMFNKNVSTNSLYGLYTRGALIFVNSTIVDAQSKGSTALLLAGNINESYPATIVNSITVNTSTSRNGFNVGTGQWTSEYLTFDHNLYGSYDISSSVPSDKGNVLVASLNDGSAKKIDAIDGGMSYYSWSGSATGFSQTSKSAVGKAIKDNAKFGTKFYDWLDSLVDGDGTALDTDIRGVTRSTGYWPGSYQN